MVVATVEAAEQLLRDFYPVEVFAPHANPNPQIARVFITDQRVIAWVEDDVTLTKLLDEAIIGEPPERSRDNLHGTLRIRAEGGTVYLVKARGCGCGSPLKALSTPAAW